MQKLLCGLIQYARVLLLSLEKDSEISEDGKVV